MSGKRISRRDWLAILGGSTAALVTPAFGQAGQTKRELTANPGKVARQSEIEELKELAAQRMYAPTPVQIRPQLKDADHHAGGYEMDLRGGWELVGADERVLAGEYSAHAAWIQTEMPRPVQYALMRAGEVPNLWYGENFKKLQWIQQQDWYLRRRFVIPNAWRDSVIRLRFDGMDYFGLVWLDGEFLGAHEGAFGGPTFDITTRVTPAKEHELLVRLLHEPHDLLPNFDSSSENRNPRVVKPDAQDAESYQWGNRYRTMGLYQPVRIVATGRAYMEAPFVRTDAIAEDNATLWAQTMVTNTGDPFDGIVEAQIVEQTSGNIVWQGKSRQKVPNGN